MSSPVFFNQFGEDLAKGVHKLDAADDTLKIMLTDTAPDAAADAVLADITEIAAGNGYTAGGEDAQQSLSRVGGTTTIAGVDVTWTASGGSIGPFRYAVLYNSTPTSPLKPLICYWDKGSEITIADGDLFTTDFLTDELLDIVLP